MNIKRLVIENFKSIERIELIEPNPFTVFVGPNGSGKSNIFEALEFGNRLSKSGYDYTEAFRLFGGTDLLVRRGEKSSPNFRIAFEYDEEPWQLEQAFNLLPIEESKVIINKDDQPRLRYIGEATYTYTVPDDQFLQGFSRIAIYEKKPRIDFQDGSTLNTAATNLEPVLKRVLSNNLLKEEVFEWLNLFISEFKSVDVVTNSFDGSDTLLWYERFTEKPFTKRLISDGTKNILTLLAAVYQSDEPQFLCIEEPENGLHPQVMMSLVEFFRKICEEKGHYIWLNTHSEAIVRKLTTDEIVLVNKINGVTQVKQIKGRNIYDIPTDEAWLTGALGGGLPW
ncbi:AAA family ATPase [Fibrella sp. HMF5335]|uniref:AAA family ATPase n=1 Tax=Fibrella rubiginis TaxID=2817060 RepID=A0A939K6W5_9BACT|nr:ATP-binding protein [Fibrella rubiginis]MBO0938741.1 AAA family ATPase [Fibrella rubiginis]